MAKHPMKCENCRMREAVIHVKQNKNKEVRELYLCNECAIEKGIIDSEMKLDISLSRLFDVLVDSDMPDSVSLPKLTECPICKTSLSKIKREGRLGCANCYASFQKDIIAMLKGPDGPLQHAGKYPGKLLVHRDYMNKREDVLIELQQAVKEENYELAAKLRDQIKELEGNISGSK